MTDFYYILFRVLKYNKYIRTRIQVKGIFRTFARFLGEDSHIILQIKELDNLETKDETA